MKKIVVAIDGPAGAGKSTIAKLAAEKLGYAYIDTGAMYRSVAWKFLQTGKPFDEDFISGLSKTMLIDFKPEAKINRVFVDGTEVTDAIRTPEVTAIVSRVAAIGAVREAMVDQQRRMGEAGGVLMDGRDIGTVVFPNAQLKIFLTASVEERARRRYAEWWPKVSRLICSSCRRILPSATSRTASVLSVRCVRQRMPCFWIHPIWASARLPIEFYSWCRSAHNDLYLSEESL